MMFVTRQMLEDLGLPHVVALPPAALVNSRAVVAVIHRYKTLDEMKAAQWFEDGLAGGLTLMCEGSAMDIADEGYLVRLHAV